MMLVSIATLDATSTPTPPPPHAQCNFSFTHHTHTRTQQQEPKEPQLDHVNSEIFMSTALICRSINDDQN